MIGKTNVGGGNNLKNAYAIILVEYPAGARLTCTNGTKTLKAGNTYGAWAFGVPSGGTWILNCANDETGESTTTSVEITAEHQAEKVFLSFWNGELYDIGKQYENITGGWTARKQSASAVFEIREDGMYVKGFSNAAVNAAPVNAIDITEWNYITFYSKADVSFSTGSNRAVGITQKTAYASASDMSARANLLPSGQATTINITSYTGEWYPIFTSLNGADYTIVKIIMTK